MTGYCLNPVSTNRVHFLTPGLTARVDGCQKMHPRSRAVNVARELGQWKPGFIKFYIIYYGTSHGFIIIYYVCYT